MNDNPYAPPRETSEEVVFETWSAPPRARFTLDFSTLHRALRLFMRTNVRLRWMLNLLVVILLPGAGALFVAVAEAAARPHPPLVPLLVITAALLIVFNSRPFFYIMASLVALFVAGRAAAPLLGEQVIEVKDGELFQSTQIGRSFLKLSSIEKVYQAASLIIVGLPLGQFLFIPESADFGADSFDTFFAKLKAAVDAAQARLT